jgi:hypothetical protein
MSWNGELLIEMESSDIRNKIIKMGSNLFDTIYHDLSMLLKTENPSEMQV